MKLIKGQEKEISKNTKLTDLRNLGFKVKNGRR